VVKLTEIAAFLPFRKTRNDDYLKTSLRASTPPRICEFVRRTEMKQSHELTHRAQQKIAAFLPFRKTRNYEYGQTDCHTSFPTGKVRNDDRF